LLLFIVVAVQASGQGSTAGVSAQEGVKRGGILRVATSANPAHYDLHQSATVSNLYPQSPMYNTLVRANPLDGGRTIIPDLAERWEVSKDGLTYTFYLREGVKFHDGAPLTADDVVATFSKIISPPPGITSVRKAMFAGVEKVETIAPLAVRFRFKAPNPLFLSAVAVEFNVIVRKKTLEEHNYDLRRVPDYPGTGPFRFVSVRPGESWVLKRNPDYWNKGLPYLDGIEFMALPYAGPHRGTAVLTGRADWARLADLNSLKKASATAGFDGRAYKSFSANIVWLNSARKPWNEARVRRALHLAMDRLALNRTIETLQHWDIGYWLRPGGQWAPAVNEVANLPGFRSPTDADLAEAKRLLAEAGYPNGITGVDFLARAGYYAETLGPAFQDMMKRHLNISSTIRPVQTAQWFEDSAKQNYDWSIGTNSSNFDDPSDPWPIWFGTGGGQNHGGFSNAEFDRVVADLARTLDPAKRRQLAQRGFSILDREMPALVIGWETAVDVHRSYVKGENLDRLGLYTLDRWDLTWLDK
jgi:ABC-type transport system substrate-binding protein